MKQNANIALHVSLGLSMVSWKPKQALRECWKALEFAIKANDAIRANTCIDCMESVSKHLKHEDIQKISDTIKPSEEILSEPLYKVFRDRINNLLQTNINSITV